MKQGSRRYCIQCGRQIGEALFCTNPECAGLPNFYRDVPGPEEREEAREDETPKKPGAGSNSSEGTLVPWSVSTSGADSMMESFAGARQTVMLGTRPVAVLRSTSPPALEQPITVGFTEIGALLPAHLIIGQPQISARHARIECAGDPAGGYRFHVLDHGSTNGTFVGGRRIERSPLNPGDRVSFANVEFELLLVSDDPPRRTAQV